METKHLDLHVPKGWAFCTTRELEMIAEEMIRAQMVASLSRFHPFDWVEIKTRLFFRFSGVEIVSTGFSPEVLADDKRQSRARGSQRGSEQGNMEDSQEHSFRPPLTPPDSGGETATFVCRHPSLGKETFELQTWQVHSFMEQLAWLDATDSKGRPVPMPKVLWPYPERLSIRPWLSLRGVWRWLTAPQQNPAPWRQEQCRPGELLDGLSWAQYRLANDWMEVYTNASNALIAEREKHADMERIRSIAEQQENARLEVLAQLFYVSDPAEPSKVKPAPRRLLRKISEVEWQVIMFWWSSMMQYLKEQYPKCFKSSDKKPRSRSKQQPLPIELYTRSMATLQKYLGGLTEDDINRQTAHAILRHLNDMAVEAEEMEKIKRKHK